MIKKIRTKKDKDAFKARIQVEEMVKIPDYSELSEDQKRIVDEYNKKIDLSNPQTIEEFGISETDKRYEELGILVGITKISMKNIEDMCDELKILTESKNKNSIFGTIKELRIKNKNSLENEEENKSSENIGVIQEKLECIRNEIKINDRKLEIIIDNLNEQYVGIECQIICLQEVKKKLEESASEIVLGTF